jgi:hypothetical protein
VEDHGTVLARERLARLLGDGSAERVEAVMGAWRCDDGGFSPLSEPPPLFPSSGRVGGALEALAIFDEAGVRAGERVAGLVGWLARAQGDDGSWQAPALERLQPEDADPVYLTGMLAGYLSKLRSGSANTLVRAEAFLAAQFSPDLVEDGGWRRLTAYAHICTNGAFELADEALQWCGRALEKGVRSGHLSALDAARMLLVCDVQSLPAGRVDARSVLLELVALQQADGGFGDADLSTAARVDATLLGARALVRFGATGAAWTAA